LVISGGSDQKFVKFGEPASKSAFQGFKIVVSPSGLQSHGHR